MKDSKKISNPLTMIGIFAGIAEVAGTVVLPLVSGDLQRIFIWYVIGLPILLVVLFFITLNFNTSALYAPGDFKDEEHFMKLRSLQKSVEQIERAVETAKNAIPECKEAMEPVARSVKRVSAAVDDYSNEILERRHRKSIDYKKVSTIARHMIAEMQVSESNNIYQDIIYFLMESCGIRRHEAIGIFTRLSTSGYLIIVENEIGEKGFRAATPEEEKNLVWPFREFD